MNKRKQQISHCIRRFKQRFGLYVTVHDLNWIKHSIQNNQAEFIEKQSNRISKFKIIFRGKTVYVIYDRFRKTIVTVLTENMEKENAQI